MSRFVLDNTVTMAWCFSDESTAFAEALLSGLSNLADTAIVPALWLYEVANVTELAVRKGRITDQKARDFLESLADLPIEVENLDRHQIFVSARELAGKYKLTAYDASYLELSVRHRLPLATFDQALAKAARAAGINVMYP